MIKFQGILGFNCGIPASINTIDKRSQDYDRYQALDYIVTGGIETLRGFATIKDLAEASTINKGYQRSKDQKHIKDLSIFLDEGRPLSKFLPEVILVGNKENVNLTRFQLSGKVSSKIIGQVDNLEHYSIDVAEKSLKRIDGNHRLEAGENKNLIISFAIILWPESSDFYEGNRDNEAFLFHFLNGKAKKLTPEENYKGLATSTTWLPDELKQVNPVIPHLQHFLKIIKQDPSFNTNYFSNGPLSQIADVLTELGDFTLSTTRFEKIVLSTLHALDDFQKFQYLKTEFNHLLPQLAFINFYYEKPLENLITISSWLKKYKYEKGSFENAKNLYDIADKQLKVVYLKVFVAMPFWKNVDGEEDIKEVIKYNKVYEKALNEVVGKENPHIKLELIPIMLRRGKAVKIDSQILLEIEASDIFIGDITENNVNVIFEIGYASALNKPTIILKKKSFTEAPPFDIDKILYKKYDYDDSNFEKSLISIIKLNLPVILDKDFNLTLNKVPAKGLITDDLISAKTKKSLADESIDSEGEELSNNESVTKTLQDYEDIYMDEAMSSVAHVMSKAVWDFEKRIIEITYLGKLLTINSLEQLEQKLEEIAIEAGYPLIPDEGEDRDIINNNADWYGIVQKVLLDYSSQLKEIGWY